MQGMGFTAKDEDLSNKLRLEGNAFYRRGADTEALQKYYLALDCAPQNGLSYARAMCNIAVTLINLGFPEYSEVLLNRVLNSAIDLEKVIQVESLVKKLEQCRSKTFDSLFVPPVQQLYKGPNDFYSQVSSAVKVGYSKERGRHFIACEDIPAGSVIILAKPNLLVTTRFSTNCSSCCRILPLSYIPCKGCNARFCNEECRRVSHNFHWLVFHTNYIPDQSAIDLAVRIVMHYTRKEIEDCFASPPNRTEVDKPYDENSFAAIMCLQQHEFLDSDHNLAKAAAAIMKCDKFLKELGYLSGTDDEATTKEFILYALKAVLGRIELNAHLIYHEPCEWIVGNHVASQLLNDAGISMMDSFHSRRYDLLKTSEAADDVVAVCLLPIVSIANHSCVPNLITSFSDKDERCIVVRTSRDVFAGEELLHNYGPILGLHSFETRQLRLRNDFTFVCRCEACVMNGSHPVDRRLSCRMCCFCHIDFLPQHKDEFRCAACATDRSQENTYRDLQKSLTEIDAALQRDDWNWDANDSHEKAFSVFEKALGIYFIGHRKLEEFVVEACVAAVKAGYFEYADNYVHFLSELRKLVFDGRYCPFLANGSLILAVFEIIHMKIVPRMRSKDRFRTIKKNINVARSIFHKIYGEGSFRDCELDLLLQKATELMDENQFLN